MVIRVGAIAGVAAALVACGGGGGGSSTGFLDLQNTGNQSSFGGCGISFEVTRPNGSSRRTASVGPCGFFSMELPTGLWNVRARALFGGRRFRGDGDGAEERAHPVPRGLWRVLELLLRK
ncbi:MAG: hypothetical protein ACREQY_19520 [Candidatus Binatia bacterium]